MRRCSVPGCYSNFTKPYVSVFTFPRNPEICKLWLKNIGRPALKVHDNIGVCIKHFEKRFICGIRGPDSNRKKVTIKHGSVPTIFEDVCSSDDNSRMEEKMRSVDNFARMQRKNIKTPLSSVFEVDKTNKSNRQDDEKKGTVKSPKKVSMNEQHVRTATPKKVPSTSDSPVAISPKKVSPTTDRPIITVIKAEDRISDDEKSPENMDEDSDCAVESSSSKSFTIPSPFKNLPNVSVCLKEEDRVPFTRELKGVKRSSSTGSNSSTGSTDAQKSAVTLTKRKKIEKPAPVVIGRQNDCYCWVCHRENVTLCCIACPRAYHFKCAGETSAVTPDWVCPECQRVLAAENVDTRSSTLSEISLDKLCALLKLSLNKMKQRAPIAFHQPVSLEHYPLYLHYVIYPMDFSLLEKNIKQKIYGCTEAFLADVKWIAHNSCVFNGTQHPLSTNAKNLVKSCDQDMQEIEVCPDCFVHSVIRNKYWFSEVCRKPHPLVWAKLKGFPYWPAKVVRIVDGNVDARFFGAHDRAWVPLSQCYHLSKEMPTTSKPKKKGNYEVALDELNVHVHLLIQKFGCFEYAPYRTSFSTQNTYLMYHGIDIDKATKEDISIDNSTSQSEIKFFNSERENRFASFMESESEKSNADETSQSKNSADVQNNSLKIDEAGPKPFFFKERKSIDSMLSEKEMSVEESNEDKTSVEPNKIEEKKTAAPKTVLGRESGKISDTDQLRKLELALERIKGYVSLNDDVEKEAGESQGEDKEENKVENEKSVSEEVITNKTEISKLSPLFKKTVTLPVIESNAEEKDVEDVSIALQTAKNTDSFFLKLNQTIESCKAKLGISEINDDISSDESGGEGNASRSDEEDEDNSTESEAEEEASEDDEEAENMEASDEEAENEEKNKLEDKDESEDSDDEDSESEEESNSQSSDTDIECISGASPKKAEKSNLQNNIDENCVNEASKSEDEACTTNEGIGKELTNDSSEAIITNPDMQVPEVTIEDSGSLQIVGGNSSSESSNEAKENSESSPNEQCNVVKSPQTIIPPKKDSANPISACSNISSSEVNKDISNAVSVGNNDSNVSEINSSTNKNKPLSSNDNNSTIEISPSSKVSTDKRSDAMEHDSSMKENGHIGRAENSPTHCKNEPEDEDDDIFICTPTRPKSPPVIILDDDQENEDSSVSDTFAVKSPPYSTSAESFNTEESATKTNSGDDSTPKRALRGNRTLSNEKPLLEKKLELNGSLRNLASEDKNSDLDSPTEKRKRKLSSDSSYSEDDVQIVTPVKKAALTGAIRTFNKPNNGNNNNARSLKPATPTMETVKRNLEKESLNQLNKSPLLIERNEMETDASSQEQTSVPQSAGNVLNSPMIDASNLSDKDKEILFLRGKLNCIMTAYKIQSWKCSQEREELRHNMNLIIMEMRASLESDKKQAIETLVRKFEQEKQKCMEETKRKQWCASCLNESRYACCWNTSYCSLNCQKRHFPEHHNTCTQLKDKNVEIELKQQKPIAPKPAENKESKKLIILNMKSPEISQQSSVNKSQIQVMPAKNPLQIVTSTASSNNIQFVLAPIKSAAESSATSTVTSASATVATTSKEQNLDSAQIIHQVRNKVCDLSTAISLLKRKNMESSFPLMNKKETNDQKEEINLEEIYFPSPPKITFEGYETAVPEPNLVIPGNEDTSANCDADSEDSELPKRISPEPDVILSDNDDMDNEMVHIGHGIDVKAKFLNKCLVYGQTAKKLTRCLMDIIFPDIKLLASCSAFGQKSNVTKLTRAALPTRKVHAIIDFVTKRFPDASRSEIVLAINMKCKEARVILSKKAGEESRPRKTMIRRLLAREKEGDLNVKTTTTAAVSTTTTIVTATAATSITTTTAATTVTATTVTTTATATSPSAVTTSQSVTSPVNKTSPNVVCVKSSSQPQALQFSMPNKPHLGANILRCGSQLLLRPKSIVNTVGNATILAPPRPKKSETVRNLLANKVNLSMGNLTKDGTKLVMALDTRKSPTTVAQPVSSSAASPTNTRPYIIIGSHVNAVRPPSSVQHPALPVSSHIKK